jgi:O-antigen/teichoic acid export membrane protein
MNAPHRAVPANFVWAGLSQGARIILQILTLAILSRLLPPADFGIVAIANVVTTFAALIRDMGTSAAVIQRDYVAPELLDTVFWFNVLVGLTLALVIALLAMPLASGFRQPRLGGVLLALTVTFPSASAGAVHQALLERSMCFKTLARIEISSAVLALFVAVWAALKGFGVYSLVLNSVAISLLTTSQLWLASIWRPRRRWSAEEFAALRGFSGNLFGFQFLNYLSRNADTILIGRFLGAIDVGLYNMGYRIMLFPLTSLSSVISRVLFPVLSRRQTDLQSFASLYMRAASSIAFVTAPLMAGIWVLRVPFVEVVLGERWLPVASVLAWLAPVGLVQSVLTTVGIVYMATGKTKYMMRWGLFAGMTVVIAISIGLNWGYLGVAKAYAIANLGLAYPGFSVPLRLIGLRFRHIVLCVWRPVTAAAGMAAFIFFLSNMLGELLTAPIRLAVLAMAGATVYLSIGIILMRSTMCQFFSMLAPIIGRKSAA